MKFLKESDYIIEDKELKINGKCKQFTTSEQAHMLSLVSSNEIEKRLELSKYALENCVKELFVSNEAIDTSRFANYADLSDADTIKTYLAIGELCSVANVLQEEEIKK